MPVKKRKPKPIFLLKNKIKRLAKKHKAEDRVARGKKMR